jgi:hypothetical protein
VQLSSYRPDNINPVVPPGVQRGGPNLAGLPNCERQPMLAGGDHGKALLTRLAIIMSSFEDQRRHHCPLRPPDNTANSLLEQKEPRTRCRAPARHCRRPTLVHREFLPCRQNRLKAASRQSVGKRNKLVRRLSWWWVAVRLPDILSKRQRSLFVWQYLP